MSPSPAKTAPEIYLTESIPPQLAVGKGQYQLIQGTVFCAGATVKELIINQSLERDCQVALFKGSEPDTLEFFISILWKPTDAGQAYHLALTLIFNEHDRKEFELGSIALIKAKTMEVAAGSTLGEMPLIAICLATYNPDSRRQARQIESILCQSYENWLLVISDDCSDSIHQNDIESLCNLDPRRIRLYRHEQNLGFYRNFERALNYVPKNAEYIALSDQDDEWYPEKLQNLFQELKREPEAVLAYSDMRIVAESGKVISNTYWQNRKNEYRDFNTVFIANTVTGAASLFKHELLGVALPFPEPVGGAFHDHWLACVALCAGKIAYLAEPMYDYIQYPDSVIGHCDFDSVATKQLKTLKVSGEQIPGKWQGVYRQDYLRLQLIADTLKTRVPESRSHSTLNLLNGGIWSVLKLIRVYIAGRLMRRTTNRAELGLAMSLLFGKGQ